MNVSLDYGHNSITPNIPDKNYMGTLNLKDTKKLANPIGSKKLKELISSIDKVVFWPVILVDHLFLPLYYHPSLKN